MEKWKNNKTNIIITTIITLCLPILIGILLWDRLPAEIATHFDSDGIPNGWSSKAFTVFGLPAFICICHVLCCVGICADPKQNRVNDKIFKLILRVCPVVSIFCAVSIYGYALNMGINVDTLGSIFVGVLFIIIGNYLPKCRQNYTVGIKLPWTLNDEENWNRTHRFAGWMWMIGGLLFIVSAFVNVRGMWTTLVLMLLMIFVPLIYSFVHYVRHK